MPVWRIQHDRMKVGTRVPNTDPPMWVAEVKQAPSFHTMVSNAYARKHNRSCPERFLIPILPEPQRWWHRLTAAQLFLPGVS